MKHANNKNNNGLSLRGIRIIFTFPYILFYIFKSCAETDFFLMKVMHQLIIRKTEEWMMKRQQFCMLFTSQRKTW